MHRLDDLKDMLCEELEAYGEKDLTAGSLDVIDKLAHTIKNLNKIIDEYEYSNDYRDERSGRMSRRERERSYARKRDAMGRYSRDSAMIDELRELMNDAPDEKTRKEFEKFISKIEMM